MWSELTEIKEIKEIKQLRILELENPKKEKDESYKKTSIDHSFNIINYVLIENTTAINNKYSKSVLFARYYEYEIVNGVIYSVV